MAAVSTYPTEPPGSNQDTSMNSSSARGSAGGTPTSEITITYPEIDRRASEAQSYQSYTTETQLLNGSTAPSILSPEPYHNGSIDNFNGHTRPQYMDLARRLVPDDYFNTHIKNYVAETGWHTGTIQDIKQRHALSTKYGWTPNTELGRCLLDCRDADALRLVSSNMKSGSWLNRRTGTVMTDLHFAAAFGVIPVVNALLETTIRDAINRGNTLRKLPFIPQLPIDFAAAGDHVEIVAALIQAGATIDSSASVTPLCFAVQSKSYGAVDLLLEHGSDPLDICDYGSPLHRACKANDKLLVRALSSAIQKPRPCIIPFQIFHPIPIVHPSLFGLGSTKLLHIKVDPFAWAVFNGSYDAVEVLLAAGVSPDIEYSAEFISGGKRVTHVTAISLGAARGFKKIVELLLVSGQSAKVRDHAFAAAVYNREEETARVLSDAGARNSFVTRAWASVLGVEGVDGGKTDEKA